MAQGGTEAKSVTKDPRTCLRGPGRLKYGNQIKKNPGTSLVAQWLRILLPIQGHGFEPWSRKIPHAAEQLSLCATTTEPAL